MLTTLAVIAALGGVATTLSLLYLAKQTKVANHLALVGAHDRLTDLAMQVDHIFIERPTLRKYFYNGEDCYQLPAGDQAQVTAVAEYICDFLENSLLHEDVFGKKVIGGWEEYSRQLLRDSVVIREFLHANRSWYDDVLGVILDDVESYRGNAILGRADEITICDLASLKSGNRTQVLRAAGLIYEASFPAFERDSTDAVFGGARGDRIVLVALEDEVTVVGFACILDIKDSAAGLLEYLAVRSDRRSGGIGALLLRHVALLSRDRGMHTLFLELEDPEWESSSSDSARRVEFYERNRCHKVSWTSSYVIPDFTMPTRAVPMLLFEMRLSEVPVHYNPFEMLRMLYESAYPGADSSHLELMLGHLTPALTDT